PIPPAAIRSRGRRSSTSRQNIFHSSGVSRSEKPVDRRFERGTIPRNDPSGAEQKEYFLFSPACFALEFLLVSNDMHSMKEIAPAPPPFVRNDVAAIQALFHQNVIPSYG